MHRGKLQNIRTMAFFSPSPLSLSLSLPPSFSSFSSFLPSLFVCLSFRVSFSVLALLKNGLIVSICLSRSFVVLFPFSSAEGQKEKLRGLEGRTPQKSAEGSLLEGCKTARHGRCQWSRFRTPSRVLALSSLFTRSPFQRVGACIGGSWLSHALEGAGWCMHWRELAQLRDDASFPLAA